MGASGEIACFVGVFDCRQGTPFKRALPVRPTTRHRRSCSSSIRCDFEICAPWPIDVAGWYRLFIIMLTPCRSLRKLPGIEQSSRRFLIRTAIHPWCGQFLASCTGFHVEYVRLTVHRRHPGSAGLTRLSWILVHPFDCGLLTPVRGRHALPRCSMRRCQPTLPMKIVRRFQLLRLRESWSISGSGGHRARRHYQNSGSDSDRGSGAEPFLREFLRHDIERHLRRTPRPALTPAIWFVTHRGCHDQTAALRFQFNPAEKAVGSANGSSVPGHLARRIGAG